MSTHCLFSCEPKLTSSHGGVYVFQNKGMAALDATMSPM